MKFVIRNGMVVTPRDRYAADLVCEDGLILALKEPGSGQRRLRIRPADARHLPGATVGRGKGAQYPVQHGGSATRRPGGGGATLRQLERMPLDSLGRGGATDGGQSADESLLQAVVSAGDCREQGCEAVH